MEEERMAVVSWDSAETRPREGDPEGYTKLYVNESIGAKKLWIHLSVLGPHRKPHEAHRHDEEEVFFILEGEARFMVEDKELKAGPMTAVYIPPGKLHGLENVGDKPLKYLVIIAK
ncbi:MAG: cupin [Candidatus Bathyarchaeota archaeon B24]|nr:MAG: cupin [Candidatus Bathyarchaeota archaeon B24]